ncbi:glycosyltransferase family 4 protein [Lactovum odontotermitis]
MINLQEKKRVNFILPENWDVPIGGYKVVYDYANYLSTHGYKVAITFLDRTILKPSKYAIVNLSKRLFRRVHPSREVTWAQLDPSIQLFSEVSNPRKIIDSDFVFATAATTANFVQSLTSEKGKKYYFIQNYEAEAYGRSQKALEDTYKLGFNNIVISKSLEKIVSQVSGKNASFLPNFYDEKNFWLEESIEKRENVISLLSHFQLSKRTKFGLEIIAEVKKVIPDLQVELFGASKYEEELPNYVHFTYRADVEQLRKEIYGQSKVYLMPTVLEGWGLTGMEAQASGAVLLASRIDGITMYATPSNSVLVEPDNKQAFVDALIRLLQDDAERIKLGKQALRDLKRFSLESSGKKLVEILRGDK